MIFYEILMFNPGYVIRIVQAFDAPQKGCTRRRDLFSIPAFLAILTISIFSNVQSIPAETAQTEGDFSVAFKISNGSPLGIGLQVFWAQIISCGAHLELHL